MADHSPHEIGPKLPSGRYKGTRGTSAAGERLDVEYNLIFDHDGNVQGTLLSPLPNMDVRGWFCPIAGQFQWAEGNHQFSRNFEAPEGYVGLLADISREEYSGSLRHVEVSMKVAEEDDSGILSLVGKYISSDGSQGMPRNSD
ncbi:hypothetical protein BSKO_11765 [Bryopsis sp. KO-2023]|nr:hypothetical protein BSKO_11765 [Bryopsis sp. KO-2023]